MPRLRYGWLLEVDALNASLLPTQPVRLSIACSVGRDPNGRSSGFMLMPDGGDMVPCGGIGWRPSSGSVRFEFISPVDVCQSWSFTNKAPELARQVLRDDGAPEHVVLDALLASVASEINPQGLDSLGAPAKGWLLYRWQPGAVFEECTDPPRG